MSDSPKSSLRNANGPRAVGAAQDRSSGRTLSRRHRESDQHGEKRSKRDSPPRRSSEKTSTHRRKQSTTHTGDVNTERPSFDLDVISQPERGVILGMPVHTSVLISLRLPASNQKIDVDSVDTSGLFAVVSLVAENRNGERVPLESGVMTGQKLFDSVHVIPDECAESLASSQPCRLALGYFSFPDLLIVQSGTYRIRTTLVKMSSSGDVGAATLTTVDSDVIKVERRNSAAIRRQRMYD